MIYTPSDTMNYEVVRNIEVTIKVIPREVSSIAITTAPTNIRYYEGQEFDPTGMVIEVTYNDGGTAVIDNDYATKGVTFTPSGALQTTGTEITVTYREKTATQAITVEADYITDITITAPNKTGYNYGESIDLTGATITKIWASGIVHTDDTIPMTKDMLTSATLSSFDMMTLGTHIVGVTFNGITSASTFQIIVKDYISGIEIEDKTKLKTDYIYGDTINVQDKTTNADLYIIIKYAGGTPDTREVLTASMVSGFDMTDTAKLGQNQTVTVSYCGFTDTYTIVVNDQIKGIEIAKEPTKKVYKLNETSNFSDMIVKNTMKSGLQGTTLLSSEYTVTGFNSTTIGEKTITVIKNGTTFSDTFKIKVIDATTGMNITKLPKQTYNFGEALDLTTGEISVTKQTGIQVISMTDPSVRVTGYNPNKLGEQTLTVTYSYQEDTENGIEENTMVDTFTVSVVDYWTGKIVITALPDKLRYKYGEDIELTGGKVAKVMASGAKEDEVEITGQMISGYDSNKVGTQIITVTNWGSTATFNVTLIDEVIGISMNTLPNKVEYTKGEAIDVTGATINVTKTSGTSVISVTKQMISGYDPNKTGTQLITVSYEGKTTQFIVNVKEATVKPTKPSNNKPTTSNITKYIVTFVDYDGTVIKTEEVIKGNAATAPELENRKGYKFIGWDKKFDAIEGDITVVAQYEKIINVEVQAPDDMKITKGSELDLSEVTLVIKDDEGNVIEEIPVTKDMISRFDSEKIGTQNVTVTYVDEDGEKYVATFKVRVIRPVETLGEKDKQEDTNNIKDTLVPATIGLGVTGLLLLLIALLTKKNVEIYALTEEGRKLIGKEKISKNNRRIVLDVYEKQLENANIEIVLNKNITEKLDEQTVEVLFKGKKSTYRIVKEDNKEFSIKMKNV